MRLITIRFSHFCEKARWALDLYGVPYEEEGHLPGFHIRAVKRAGAAGEADRASSTNSTPALILDDGTRLTDSREIVRFASDRYGSGGLYPEGAAEHEDAIHDRLAVHSRRVAYGFLFKHRGAFVDLMRGNVPGWESAAARASAALAIPALKKAMGINAASVARSISIVDEEAARLGDLLAGREFLVGDAFSAADLALACGLAPALVPHASEGFGAYMPALSGLPDDYRAHVERWRATAAGAHALRMFAEHRGQRALPYGAAA